MGTPLEDDAMTGDIASDNSEETAVDANGGHPRNESRSVLTDEAPAKLKKFDVGRGKRETWSLEMLLVLLKHLSNLKGTESPLKNPKTRLEECERLRLKLRAEVDEEKLNDITAEHIKRKIQALPLRVKNPGEKGRRPVIYTRDDVYHLGPAAVSLRVLLPNLRLEDQQQAAYDRHEDPFEVEEDVGEPEAEALSPEEVSEKEPSVSTDAQAEDEDVVEVVAEDVSKDDDMDGGDDEDDDGADEEEDGSEYEDDAGLAKGGEFSAMVVRGRAKKAPADPDHASPPSAERRPRPSLIVTLVYNRSAAGRADALSIGTEPLEHTKQARPTQDEDFHVNKRRKLEETEKAAQQNTEAAEQPARASAEHLNDTTTGVQQRTTLNQEWRPASQRAVTVPSGAAQPSSIPASDTTPQSTPRLYPGQGHGQTASPTTSAIDAPKLRLASLGRNRLKSKAPLHDFGERIEDIGKKIIRAVRNRADGAASGPLDALFLSLTGMKAKTALGEIIRADQQDPLRLSELICAIIGAAVAEWALIPSVLSTQSQKLLDCIRTLLSSQHQAGANKALEAGTDMLLEEARKIHIEQEVSPNIGKTACELRDDLIEILSPLLSIPRSNIDPSMWAALAHAPSASSESSRPQRGQSVFPRQAWLYTWETDLKEIFASALKLRAEIETAGGNYEFVWPRLAEIISLEGLGHDAMILLPMLPQLKGQCQSMYAGPMGQIEVVYPGQVFWR